jgi:hypothetical protein
VLTVVNFSTAACGLVAVWAAIQIYRLTRARSVLVLVLATGYLVCMRLAVATTETFSATGWVKANTSYLIAPFWPLLALALVLLLHSLRSLFKDAGDRRVSDTAHEPERRKQS